MKEQAGIIEGNRLIAEFMGFTYVKDGDTFYDKNNMYFSEQLKYHTSWDWLMPVVKKIEDRSKNYHVCIFDNDCQIYEAFDNEAMPIFSETEKTKIEATWLAVVEFIKFWNQNKTQQP